MNVVKSFILIKRIFTNSKYYFRNDLYFSCLSYDSNHADFVYPIDFSYWYKVGHYQYFDDDGIPLENYRKFGKKYNWSKIASYALYHFNEYRFTGELRNKIIFLNVAGFITKKAFLIDKMALWLYDIPWQGLKANWPSAIAQGEIISILVRAFFITKEPNYLDLAFKSYEALKTEIKKGGVLNHYEDDNGIVLEEFPQARQNELSHILNGFIFGIIGVYELFQATQEKKVYLFYKSCINSLKNHIDHYLVENSRWSLYAFPHKKKNYVTPVYQSLHMSLVYTLYQITAEEKFRIIAKLWNQSYHQRPLRLKALLKKIVYRLNTPTDM